MLSYTINDKPFILSRDTSVRLVWRNPACFTSDILGDYGIGITIPDNPHNRNRLNSPGRFEKYGTGSDREYPGFAVRKNGVLLLAGTLVIQNTNPENGVYSGWLRSQMGDMGKALRELKLPDMAWPTSQTFDNKEAYDDDDDHYNIVPIHNQGFWEGKGAEENGVSTMQSAAIDNYASMINVFDAGNILPGCVVSPFLHLRYVISELFRLNKWFINRNDMIDPKYNISWLKNMMVYNNFSIVDVSIPGTISKKIREWNPDLQQWEEYFIDSFNPGWESIASFNYADLLPRVSVKEFLLGLQNSINYIFRPRNNGKIDIIDRNEILSGDITPLQQYLVSDFEINERPNVRLKFMPQYDKDDARFKDNFEDLSDRFADYGAPVATFDDLALIASPRFGELRLVKDVNKIYEYTWMVVEDEQVESVTQVNAVGWKLASSGPQPYVYGTEPEEEQIDSAVSTLQQTGGTPNNLITYQKGNIASMRSLYADFGLRLLPFNMELYSQSLYWEGENGLFKKRWEKWARFWKNRLPVSAQFQLPLNMVYYVSENITGKFSTNKGEFIIEEMETEIGMDYIGKTKVTGYKV